MYQGTTPSIPIRFKDIDLTDAKIYLSLYDERNKKLYTFASGEGFDVYKELNDTVGTLELTQEQTLEMGVGLCTLQARWIFPDGSAGATKKVSIQMNSVLQKEVISYD